MVFRGKLDIPVIDWRHYLEDELDMHNSHQSFAARQRLLNYDGDASNQLIWFTDARPATGVRPDAAGVPRPRRWIKNIQANPEQERGGEQAGATRRTPASRTNGTLLASGDDVWSGILDDGAAGACTQAFQIHSTSRIVAGGPIEGGVFQCALPAGGAGDRAGPLRLVGADAPTRSSG